MSNNKENINNQIWWIVAFVAIAAILIILLLSILDTKDKTFVAIAGVLGGYVSLFSLVLMFAQFKSIKDISRETKNKMDSLVSISDLAKKSELAHSAQGDVKEGKDDLAIYKIQIIKETLIKLERMKPLVLSFQSIVVC